MHFVMKEETIVSFVVDFQATKCTQFHATSAMKSLLPAKRTLFLLKNRLVMSRAIFQNPAVARRRWYLFDAAKVPVGRMSQRIAHILQGKHKPVYNPGADCGDNVVVVNAKSIAFTGRKWDQKVYRWHTGFPGGLKQVLAKELHDDQPDKVLWKAVYGQLPKNRLRRHRMQRLRIYAEDSHPHNALIEPLPAHLRIESKLNESNRVRTDAELADIPGYVISWHVDEATGELVVEEHVQHADKIPKKPRKGHGLFKKGDHDEARVELRSIEELTPFDALRKESVIVDAYDAAEAAQIERDAEANK